MGLDAQRRKQVAHDGRVDDRRGVARLGEALGEVLLVDREVGQPRVVERADRAALLGKRRAELFPELAQLFQPAVGIHDRPTRITSSSTMRDASRSRSTG